MHEHMLASLLNNSILRLCNDHGWNKVRKILIRAGGIGRINPELMTYIFKRVSQGTITEGAEFAVMCTPVVLKCKACGRKDARDDLEKICPSCGSDKVEIVSGFDLSIEALEVDQF